MERRNPIADLGDHFTLSDCRELCELEIYASSPGTAELNVISSIASTKIQKMKFTRKISPETLYIDHPNWKLLDNSLCRLVGQLESGLRLEVEFRELNGTPFWRGEGFEMRLPRFCEEGGVRGIGTLSIQRTVPRVCE